MPTHPIALDVRKRLIDQAADLHAGMADWQAAGTEYLRGMAELIANTTGAFEDDDDAPNTITRLILEQIAVNDPLNGA
ncbi:hypothetical protein SEA_BLAB_100 [Microbacterium phage Blab]|nr:hypothetical protein SEA_BLAB_100 [Microbacterium phage Blab]UVG34471.1 hypothetical protein SEA_GAZEBO_102 [Microbacterium phage Gazebo]